MRSFVLLVIAVFFLVPVNAQIKKFGKISKDEFNVKNEKKYAEDDAIILFRQYNTKYTYDQMLGWKVIMKVHERILLKNKDGFDYATKVIRLYSGDNDEEKVRIKAITYNLENNKVVKTKLDKKEVYRQELSKHWFERRFTMPNIKEGSIVEWSYSIESPYVHNINDLIYKTLIPIKYFEAEVSVPEFFHYKYMTTPFFPVTMEEEVKKMTLQIDQLNRSGFEHHNYEINLLVYHLVLKDVEPITVEPYMNSINNYIGRVRFELSYVRFPNSTPETFSTTWDDVCKTVYKKASFGGQLKKSNYFKNDLNALIAADDTPKAKANKILAFVKDKVRWNKEYQIISEEGVKAAYKNGSGNVAEINFILIAMLREAGLDAYPVLASTDDHGTPFYPTLEGFNYVLTAVQLDGNFVLMDPTEKYAPAGVLPRRILNWEGKLIKKDGTSQSIQLFPVNYAVSNKTIKAGFNEDQEIKGFCNEIFTGNLALSKRNKYAHSSKDDIIKDYEDNYDNISVENIRLLNMEKIDKPLKIMSQFNLEDEVEEVGGKLVFSPLLFLKEKENIFKSDKRDFPIYFGYPYMSDYTVNIAVPDTYEIVKLPENISLSLPENIGAYSYQIQKTPKGIGLSVKMNISTPMIPNTLYGEVKNFFEKIFNKENEKVIIEKK